jgi:hypothetical protein
MPATTAKTKTKAKRFATVLKGYPLQGFIETHSDGTETVHLKRPVVMHYRPKRNFETTAEGQSISGESWYLFEELRDLYGFEKPPENWHRQRRPRIDHSSFNHEGIVYAASDEYEAQAKFRAQFKVTQTNATSWDVEEVPANTPLGLFGAIKRHKEG